MTFLETINLAISTQTSAQQLLTIEEYNKWSQIVPTDEHYTIYHIPKPNGKTRLIEEPCPELKQLQRSLIPLLETFTFGNSCFCRKERGPIQNARHHHPSFSDRLIVKMDVKDFFPTTTMQMFFSGLDTHKQQYPGHRTQEINVLEYIAPLFFVLDSKTGTARLPTGAPTSPLVSSIAFSVVDYSIAVAYNTWKYSRYMDDLTFSTANTHTASPTYLIQEVTQLIEAIGYKVNKKKTQILNKGSAQVVTGILINSQAQELRPTREYRRNLRAAVDEAARTGQVDSSLAGRMAYLKQVSPKCHDSMVQYFLRRVERWHDHLPNQ
jgi:RNA-directed DNA polymerase